jgi:excisionase family DNA binding protein
MTTAEVARHLQLHPRTNYKLVRQRQIPAQGIGSSYRFYWAAIEKLITPTNK